MDYTVDESCVCVYMCGLPPPPPPHARVCYLQFLTLPKAVHAGDFFAHPGAPKPRWEGSIESYPLLYLNFF